MIDVGGEGGVVGQDLEGGQGAIDPGDILTQKPELKSFSFSIHLSSILSMVWVLSRSK